MHHLPILTALAGAVLVTGLTAPAPAVELSLRPQPRPALGRIAPAAALVTPPPVISLRPQPRPAELAELAELAVARPGDTAAGIVTPASANLAFNRWIDGFRGRALAAGIRPGTFDNAFRGVRYNTGVIARDRNQSEFKSQIWDYLDSAASPLRIKNGQEALRRHGRTLQRIEAHFGVEKEVVTAIWGMESTYGTRRGDIPLIEALATLSFDGRRGAFFEKQLIAALQILQAGDVRPAGMKGSWAGAMGHTQFIPTSYLAYAVDFTGDGKRDIWSDDPTDALASTAAYLRRFGWKKGQPWGVEVRLPDGFDHALASRAIKKRPSGWAALGVTDMQGRAVPDHGPAAILLPAGAQGAAFMIFDNFAVIERYNQADAYVIGVGHLSDRLKGGPAIQAGWPRGYTPLSFDERKEMQRRLQRNGLPLEKIDGVVGPNTVEAIRSYQQAAGLTVDGFPSKELLAHLRRR